MRLLLFHPEWSRSCQQCETWLYDDETGQVHRRPARTGPPTRRPLGTITPCVRCPKVPEDAPIRTRAFAIEMTIQNRLAYRHYLECQAVNSWPDDPIVRRNARIIREIEDAHKRLPLMRLETLLIGAISKKR